MFDLSKISKEYPVIAWWSGGADSAITCWLCLKWFGADKVRVVFIDTKNEDHDTYRFKKDCELWWGVQIETISTTKWDSIEDVWEHYLTLNTATGAICSSELKREVRQQFQLQNNYSYQAFGYDIEELHRAINIKKNYPDSKPFFPLVIELINKRDSIGMLQKNGITPPVSYLNFLNNNCLETGCVKGGIGYWQLFQVIHPDRFDRMAEREHEYTNKKGKPVTICKDQSKGGGLVFLKPHPNYPDMKDLSMMKGRKPEPLMECNGFCSKERTLTPNTK